jgi:hypothetical protein
MKIRTFAVASLATAALTAVVPAAQAAPPAVAGTTATTTSTQQQRSTLVFTLRPSTHGNPEGVAWDPRTQRFFVGATGDGTIYRGRLGSNVLRPYIAGHAGESAVGMKVRGGWLYVAGGTTGTVTVYAIATKHVVARFRTGTGGFLNDLVVTPTGDVYVTDSFRPVLWHLTGAQVRAGGGRAQAIPVSPEIPYQAGQFNLNGIVALDRGRALLVVDTVTGQLFRIRFQAGAPHGRTIRLVAAPRLVGGDGMILDCGRLAVVRGAPASLTTLRLGPRNLWAAVVRVRANPTLRGPSTVARAGLRYLVVNADFATSTTPFTVSGLPRVGQPC